MLRHVLNCAADVCPDYLPADFTYKHLFLLDHNAEDISCVFYPVLEWLEAALADPTHKVHIISSLSFNTFFFFFFFSFEVFI
jgi:hypothetical protein